MYSSVCQEIPEFLKNSLVYCDNLVLSRREKSCLVLTKNLKLFEFKLKQLQRTADLNQTILSELKDRIAEYHGPKGKFYEDDVDSKNKDKAERLKSGSGGDISSETEEIEPSQRKLRATTKADNNNETDVAAAPPAIVFGKYIYRNFEISKIYILIQCWNTLVILEREEQQCSGDGFKITREYNQVRSFEIVNDVDLAYQAVVKIEYLDSGTIFTKFQSHTDNESTQRQNNNRVPNLQKLQDLHEVNSKSEMKQLLDCARASKAELQLHKGITHKSFSKLRQKLVFGKNIGRSLKLEEKQILTRCGDIWLRLNASDELVIGVPLVNNCVVPNLTTVRNIKPVFERLARDEAPHQGCRRHLSEVKNEYLQGFNYTHRFYYLNENCSMDFDKNILEAISSRSNVSLNWRPSHKEINLLPGSFGILLIKLSISEIINSGKCKLFILYELDNQSVDFSANPNFHEKNANQQQICVQTIDFDAAAMQTRNREKLLISFQPSTLQQDLLTALVSHLEIKILFEFSSDKDIELFEMLLKKSFELEEVMVANNKSQHSSQLPNSYGMDVYDNDDDDEDNTNGFFNQIYAARDQETKNKQSKVFFNNHLNSLWFSFIAIRENLEHQTTQNSKFEENFHEVYDESDRFLDDDNDSNRNDDISPLNLNAICWKFYLPTENKSFLFLKMLFNDLILHQCNVKSLALCSVIFNNKNSDFPQSIYNENSQAHCLSFGNSLRKEIKLNLEYINENGEDEKINRAKLFKDLIMQQYQTDLIANQNNVSIKTSNKC